MNKLKECLTKSKGSLSKFSNKLNQKLEDYFDSWGKFVYKKPWLVILISLLVIPAFGYGFFLHNEEEDGIKLWVPQNSRGINDKDKANELFESDARPTTVYLTHKEPGKNVIDLEVFKEIQKFDTRLKNEVEYEGETYEDICTRPTPESPCDVSSHPLEFYEKEPNVYSIEDTNNDELLDQIQSGKNAFSEKTTSYITVNGLFGKTTPETVVTNSDGSNNILEAQAISWQFNLELDDNFERLRGYEEAMEEFAQNFNKDSALIQVYLYSSTGIDRGTDESVEGDLQLVQFGLVLIIVWCFLALGKLYTYKSRLFMAFIGILSVGASYIEAIGIGSYFGLDGSIVTQVLPFLLLGIGVDDMFVLVFNLEQAPEELEPGDKIRYMMKHAGVSVTITTLTNVLSFLMGSITSLFAIRSFCIYASIGLFFAYVNLLTLFSAVLVYDVWRSSKKIGDCWGACFYKPEVACRFTVNEDGTEKESFSKKLMRDYYAKAIVQPAVSISVIICFVAFLGVSIYGLSQLQLDFDVEWFVEDDFYIKETIDVRDEYFANQLRELNIFTEEAEFYSKQAQTQFKTLYEKLESCEGCTENWIIEGTLSSWYKEFNSWVGGQGNLDEDGLVPESSFSEYLNTWLTDQGKLFQGVINIEGEIIQGTIMKASMRRLVKAQEFLDFMEDIREITDDYGPGYTFPLSESIIWAEHYAVFGRETAISITCSLVAVFTIILFLMADLYAAFFVVSLVGMIVVDLLGLLYFWDETLNVVTITQVIIAIGISVDYTSHVTHTFKVSSGDTKKLRVVEALDKIGISVLNGGISTLLAVLMLSVADSYIFRAFFKCFFGIVVFGIAHGLLFLPAVLCFIGPANSYFEKVDQENSDGKEINT